jgi:CRISPR-associated protein Cas2
MLYLICYDIENDRLRTRVSTKLQDCGLERVQYSVFVGKWSEKQKQDFDLWVATKLKIEGNFNILQLPLTKYTIAYAQHWGVTPPDWEYLQGEKLTLIL